MAVCGIQAEVAEIRSFHTARVMCGRLRVGKGFFDVYCLSWSVLSCVRPVDAALVMAAGHNAFRRSGPDQKHAVVMLL